MSDGIEEIMQLARKMEIDGKDLYSKASENATSKKARSFFASLAEDETRHLSIVEKMGKGLGVDVDDMPSPAERIQTVFSKISSGDMDELATTSEEQEVIDIALKMEKKSYNLYERAADAADNDQKRKLLERLKQEENQHYEMLQSTAEYLNENHKWFLDEEDGLLTGDVSSLG